MVQKHFDPGVYLVSSHYDIKCPETNVLTSCSMWLMYFVRALNGSLTSNLAPYITSDFSNHSLLPVIQIVVSIMSAACTMPIAKLLNLWDRTIALSLMLVVSIIGLIVMACCHNITIYCVAQVYASYAI